MIDTPEKKVAARTSRDRQLIIDDLLEQLFGVGGFGHVGWKRACQPTLDILPHSILISPNRYPRPDDGIILRDFILRVKDGPATVVKTYMAGADIKNRLKECIKQQGISAAPALHVIQGLQSFPAGFTTDYKQEPFDPINPKGVRLMEPVLRLIGTCK